MTLIPKIKYLTNKDLLREIHLSKNTFCSFVDKSYHEYDAIVTDIANINSEIILAAKETRSARLSKEAYIEASVTDKKANVKDFVIEPESINETELIFRVMTYDHIPLAPGRKKTLKNKADYHEKVNFPPFQHWKYNQNNELECVGKSHWTGDIATGHFDKHRGNMTNNLAHMFLKLCERYATKGNVRGYTYNDEMKGQAILQLTQIGLQFDESKSSNPFAYYTAAVTNSFVRVLNIEKRNQNIRDDILEINGMNPSWTRQNSSPSIAPITTVTPETE